MSSDGEDKTPQKDAWENIPSGDADASEDDALSHADPLTEDPADPRPETCPEDYLRMTDEYDALKAVIPKLIISPIMREVLERVDWENESAFNVAQNLKERGYSTMTRESVMDMVVSARHMIEHFYAPMRKNYQERIKPFKKNLRRIS